MHEWLSLKVVRGSRWLRFACASGDETGACFFKHLSRVVYTLEILRVLHVDAFFLRLYLDPNGILSSKQANFFKYQLFQFFYFYGERC